MRFSRIRSVINVEQNDFGPRDNVVCLLFYRIDVASVVVAIKYLKNQSEILQRWRQKRDECFQCDNEISRKKDQRHVVNTRLKLCYCSVWIVRSEQIVLFPRRLVREKCNVAWKRINFPVILDIKTRKR